MRLQGKNALITGGDQGIGRGIALRFAHEGADVAIVFRSHAENAADTVREIKATGRKGLSIQADVSQLPDIQRAYSEAKQKMGRIDILVNNAGVERREPFLEATESAFD